MEKYNVHGTFYYSPSGFKDDAGDYAGDEMHVLKALHLAGHEIGWHSKSHSDMRNIPVYLRAAAMERDKRSPEKTTEITADRNSEFCLSLRIL